MRKEWGDMTSGPAKAGPLALRNFHLLQKISDEAQAQGQGHLGCLVSPLDRIAAGSVHAGLCLPDTSDLLLSFWLIQQSDGQALQAQKWLLHCLHKCIPHDGG